MKQSYKIATSLDRSYLDVEVALQAKSGVGLRPLPLTTIIVWIVAIFGSFLLVANQDLPLFHLPLWAKIVFMLVACIFTFFVTSRDGGNQSRFFAIRNMAEYMFNKKSRLVKTRSTDSATAFARIVGIKEISDKTGLVKYSDGTVAYFYRVTGNASNLLFDSDKEAIVTRVDNFYRKMPEFIRMEIVTVKEAQKVETQKIQMKRLYQNRDNTDKDIERIMKLGYKMLDEYVGGEFRSIHQYLILFAGAKEYVDKAHSILANECHASSLMFSSLEPLYKDDIVRLLHTIYAAE